MKKLDRKGTVHPSPPPPPPPPPQPWYPISDRLAFLPAAIFALAASLTSEDQEVLAYLLLSCHSSGSFSTSSPAHNNQSTRRKKAVKGGGVCGDHPPSFNCNCFRCYMSYWVRWDSSPNRQLIHQIIDAVEDWIFANYNNNNIGGRRERKKKGLDRSDLPAIDLPSEMGSSRREFCASESAGQGDRRGGDRGEAEVSSGGREEPGEKGSFRKLVNFIGQRIWSVWA